MERAHTGALAKVSQTGRSEQNDATYDRVVMRNLIACFLLVSSGLLGSAATAQNLPSAPLPRTDTVAATTMEDESSSALPIDVVHTGVRAMPQVGRLGGLIFVPMGIGGPPVFPSPGAPTALGMVVGGTVGGIVGFNRDQGADRPAGAIAGMILGALAGALAGHIYNDVRTHHVPGPHHAHAAPRKPRTPGPRRPRKAGKPALDGPDEIEPVPAGPAGA